MVGWAAFAARECAIAGRVDVTLSSDPTGIRLEIQDDGVGISDTACDRGDGHLGLVPLGPAGRSRPALALNRR